MGETLAAYYNCGLL